MLGQGSAGVKEWTKVTTQKWGGAAGPAIEQRWVSDLSSGLSDPGSS